MSLRLGHMSTLHSFTCVVHAFRHSALGKLYRNEIWSCHSYMVIRIFFCWEFWKHNFWFGAWPNRRFHLFALSCFKLLEDRNYEFHSFFFLSPFLLLLPYSSVIPGNQPMCLSEWIFLVGRNIMVNVFKVERRGKFSGMSQLD